MVDRFLHTLKANGSMGNRYKDEKNFYLQQKGISKNFNKVSNKYKNSNVDKSNIKQNPVEKVDSFTKNMGYLSRTITSFSEVQKEQFKDTKQNSGYSS